MTLPDLLRHLAAHPTELVFYFGLVPFAALLAGWMEREEDHLPPWNYLYSALLYLVAVPATLAAGLLAYRNVTGGPAPGSPELLLYVLPVASFLLTAFIVHRRVVLRTLPGFGGLAGLVGLIAVALLLCWLADVAGLLRFGSLKVQYAVALFLLVLVVLRAGWQRVLA